MSQKEVHSCLALSPELGACFAPLLERIFSAAAGRMCPAGGVESNNSSRCTRGTRNNNIHVVM